MNRAIRTSMVAALVAVAIPSAAAYAQDKGQRALSRVPVKTAKSQPETVRLDVGRGSGAQLRSRVPGNAADSGPRDNGPKGNVVFSRVPSDGTDAGQQAPARDRDSGPTTVFSRVPTDVADAGPDTMPRQEQNGDVMRHRSRIPSGEAEGHGEDTMPYAGRQQPTSAQAEHSDRPEPREHARHTQRRGAKHVYGYTAPLDDYGHGYGRDYSYDYGDDYGYDRPVYGYSAPTYGYSTPVYRAAPRYGCPRGASYGY